MADANPPMTTSMTKGERTRKALLEAAIARFGRDGYRGTSVAEIARDARLSGTAAYVYFPNKEALFVAAVDEDAAAVIEEGLESFTDDVDLARWRQTLMFTLLEAVDRHLLARRVLLGLEPEFTVRLLSIPALEQLRKAIAERLSAAAARRLGPRRRRPPADGQWTDDDRVVDADVAAADRHRPRHAARPQRRGRHGGRAQPATRFVSSTGQSRHR